MDQDKEFNGISNYNLNPSDLNNWIFFQQPYIDLSAYNGEPNGFLLNYHENLGVNASINRPYMSNLRNHYSNHLVQDNTIFQNSSQHINERQSNFKSGIQKYEQNFKSKEPTKRKEIITFQGSNRNASLNTKCNLKNDVQHYKVLSRKNDDALNTSNIAETYTKSLDIERDFPPISTNTFKSTNENKPQEKILDFKFALQKPKKVEENISTIQELDINEDDKIKKKRKRKRKKKVPLEEAKDFQFIDDEFPNLDIVQKELTFLTEKAHLKDKERTITKVESLFQDNESKKLRKRQLLYLLPNGIEGQIRIVEAKSIKKSKNKQRKTIRDRRNRPIGFLNPLDLSAPNIKRGKERLIPKVKKPSKLKKTILMCRHQKKELREAIQNVPLLPEAGDKIEIKRIDVVDISRKPVDNSSNKMHSKNFREYCNHMISNNINSMISTLLKTLINFQDKLYNRDPLKAKIKRRLCFGLREVTKFVNMKKLRFIVIAPDLEKIDIEGGLDDIVTNIIRLARESSIPCVFGLNRSSLAYLCFKKFRVGAIGVFNFDGAENQVKELLKAVDEAREQYNQLKQIMESINNDVTPINQLQSTTIDDKDDMSQHNNCLYTGHSRTPSNALSEPLSEIIEINKSMFNSIFEDQNYHNQESETVELSINDDVDDRLVESYIDNVLDCVSKLTLKD